MMKNFVKYAFAFTLLFAQQLHADVIITSEVVESAPNSSATVNFFASDPDGIAEITSVNIPIDISLGAADGDGLPSATLLTLSTPFITDSFGNESFTPFTGLGIFNFDVVVNVAQPPSINVGATPTLLFALNFDIGNAAVPGDVFNLTFDENPIQFQVNGTDTGTASLSSTPGQIVIIPVPEPSLGILSLLIGYPLLRRKR